MPLGIDPSGQVCLPKFVPSERKCLCEKSLACLIRQPSVFSQGPSAHPSEFMCNLYEAWIGSLRFYVRGEKPTCHAGKRDQQSRGMKGNNGFLIWEARRRHQFHGIKSVYISESQEFSGLSMHEVYQREHRMFFSSQNTAQDPALSKAIKTRRLKS